jgi:hypothetical protein
MADATTEPSDNVNTAMPSTATTIHHHRPMISSAQQHFAQNLPSPSSFYPHFYQIQNELPSPLHFATTPATATNPNSTSNSTFYWPPPPTNPKAKWNNQELYSNQHKRNHQLDGRDESPNHKKVKNA